MATLNIWFTLLRVLNYVLLFVDSGNFVILIALRFECGRWYSSRCFICSMRHLWCSSRVYSGSNFIWTLLYMLPLD